jgi:acetyl esterase/lipase
MKSKKILLLILLVLAMNSVAQTIKMDLYPEGKIPNYRDVGEEEVWERGDFIKISKVQIPDIAVFMPAKKSMTGEAVIICPGGGYRILSYDWEGEDIAKYLNSKGIVGIVLKSRLPVSESQIEPHKSPLLDGQRAMRIVRYHAEEWGIDPAKIGVMGFSAGGHLAASMSTHYDAGNQSSPDPIEKVSCKPDFSILVYPVISFTEDFQHKGSRISLVGADEKLMKYFSAEQQVTADTPPAILIHSADDKAVPVENSIAYYRALIQHGVQAEMHLYPHGGHGYSLAIGNGHLSEWPERVVDWIKFLRTEKQ